MRNEKGVTLVALVLSIIILLIIAAVAVSMVVGPNGIAQTVEKEKESSAKLAAQTDLSSALTSLKNTYSVEENEVANEATEEIENEVTEEVTNETVEETENETTEETSLIYTVTKENLTTLLPSYEFKSVDVSGETVKVTFADSMYKYTATVNSSLTISDFQQTNK